MTDAVREVPEAPDHSSPEPRGEARRSPRRRTLASVRVLDGDSSGATLQVTDLSADGAFIRTPLRVEQGERLRLELRLPTHTAPIRLVARVVRAGGAGIGVRFEELSARERSLVRGHAGFYEMDEAMVRLQRILSDRLPGNLLPLGDPEEIEAILGSAQERSLPVAVVAGSRGLRRFEGRIATLERDTEPAHLGGTLRLGGLDGALTGDDKVVYLAFADPPLHYALEAIVLEPGQEPRLMMPERVYLNERRTENRAEHPESWCELPASGQPGGKVRIRVRNAGRRGAALTLEPGSLLVPGMRLPRFALVSQGSRREVDGATVRYVVEEAGGGLRAGLHFDGGEEERDTFSNLQRRSTESGFRATLSRSLSILGGKMAGFLRRPDRRYAGGVEVVRYRNRRGDMVAAILDANFKTSDPGERPDVAVVVAPAILKRKEVFGLLARTVIDDLSRDGRKVVVLRFDASHVVGESTMDPKLVAEQRPYYHWTFDHIAADMEASLSYLQRRFRPDRRVLVTVSLSAIPGRKVILDSKAAPVDYWLAPFGCPDAQDMLRNYLAGLDLFADYAEGKGPETILIHGRPIRGPSLYGQAMADGLALLEDARRDLGRIAIPVTWILGTYDHWVSRSRVKEMLDAPGGGDREIFETATGHVLKTGNEAIEMFKLVSESISKHIFGVDRPACDPNLIRFARQSEAEWARVKRLRVDDKAEFWQEHLFGGPASEIGYDVMLDHPEYPRFLARQAELLEPPPGGDLADFGCGTGNFCLAMLDAYEPGAAPASLTFLDIVPEALDRTERKIRKLCERRGHAPPRLRAITADLEVSRLAAVSDFVGGRLYHVEELVNRVEGFSQQTARKLADRYGKELHAILRGTPALPQRVKALCPELDDWEVEVVLELGRAARFLLCKTVAADQCSGVTEVHTASDLRFTHLSFGDATADLQLDLPAASFDRIGCSLVLPYLYDPLAVLREIHRLLRPGGVTVISTLRPNFDPSKLYTEAAAILRGKETLDPEAERKLAALRHFGNMVSRLIELEEDGRFHFLDERALTDIVREVGFRDMSIHPAFGTPPTAFVVRAEK